MTFRCSGLLYSIVDVRVILLVKKPMHSLNDIRSMLLGSAELRQNIVRSLGSSTVALFAVFDDHGMDLLKLVGSGSLVIIDDSYYILTAAHVWEYIQPAVKLGITLTDKLSHKHLIDVAAIVPSTLKPDASEWNEWGPDLALLRIPSEHIGGIKAFLVFEDVEAPPQASESRVFGGLGCDGHARRTRNLHSDSC
jgi:predicted AlkP superfamily pyrophosphatase or phosphodiesterase